MAALSTNFLHPLMQNIAGSLSTIAAARKPSRIAGAALAVALLGLFLAGCGGPQHSLVQTDFQEMATFQTFCAVSDCLDPTGSGTDGLFVLYRVTQITNTGAQAATVVFDVNNVATVTKDQTTNDTVDGGPLGPLALTQVTVAAGETMTVNLCFIKDAHTSDPASLVGAQVPIVYSIGVDPPVSMTNIFPNENVPFVSGTASPAVLETLCQGKLP